MRNISSGLRASVAVLLLSAAPSIAWCAPGYIVELRDDAAVATVATHPSDRRERLAAVLSERRLPLAAGAPVVGRWQRVEAPVGLSDVQRTAFEASLRADPRIAGVVPDVREQRQALTPNDLRFAEQWWLQERAAGNTGAASFAAAWMRSTGNPRSGSGAVVAVLDSGITSHPELNARRLAGHDFVSDPTYAGDGNARDNDPSDPGDAITDAERAANPSAFSGCPPVPVASWHGTVIAGQVAAVTNNTEGVAAGNWFGSFLPVRVAGKCGASVADIIDGLRWAAGLPVAGVAPNPTPARVIVLSYGSTESCDANSSNAAVADTARLYQQALSEVRAAGALPIVAAGNQRSDVGRPAACAGAFAVTSLNREGYKATYANFGAAVALATPGGDGNNGATCDTQLADTGIVSTGNLGATSVGQAGYVSATGTSFAGPAVAAVASLMLAVDPTLTVAQLERGLRSSAAPFPQVPLLGNCSLADNRQRCTCTTATCGAGMLDADEALRFAAAPATYSSPDRTAPTLRDSRIEACAVLLGRPVPEPPTTPPTNPPTTPPTNPPTEPPGGGGGGGAASWPWLAALAAAAWVLRRNDRRRSVAQ